jgi:cell wall-associated NlpC family hydrolase
MTRSAEEISALRQSIVSAALGWCGTPFHDCSGVKGAGCDCAHLIFSCYIEAGLVPPGTLEAYKPQWFQHRDEPRFLISLEKYGAHRVAQEDALPGDILMYSFGRHAAHAAIIVDANTLVHAYKPARQVTTGSRRELFPRFDSAWSLLEIAP